MHWDAFLINQCVVRWEWMLREYVRVLVAGRRNPAVGGNMKAANLTLSDLLWFIAILIAMFMTGMVV